MLELNQVYYGDCLEFLPSIPNGSVDMILQDPPYNTTACKWEWDIMTKIEEFWTQWKRIIKPNGAIVMTASQPFTSKLVMSNLKMFKYEWIWDKVRPVGFMCAKYRPMMRHENILVFGNGGYNPQMTLRDKIKTSKNYGTGEAYGGNGKSEDKVYTYTHRYPTSLIGVSNAKQVGKINPTQKPVALFEYLIRTYTNEGDTVFDGFSGSGTTALACINIGRNYICIENDFNHWLQSTERVERHIELKGKE